MSDDSKKTADVIAKDFVFSAEDVRTMLNDPSKLNCRKLTDDEVQALNELAERERRDHPDEPFFDFGEEMDKRESEFIKKWEKEHPGETY